MPSTFRLSSLDESEPIETGLMRRTGVATLEAIPLNGLLGWSGQSRIGKTTTGRWLRDQINDAYDPSDEQTFRALHYETGAICIGNQEKQAVRSLYVEVLRVPLTDHGYRRSSSEELAELVVNGLIRKRMRLLLIDEAGCLSVDAIRGMVLVCDTAENMKWRMAIAFIGMDDLATKILNQPQLKGRLYDWCYFNEYSLDETKELLEVLHPHFASPKRWNDALHQEAAYIHRQVGGFPGEIVKFLRHVDARIVGLGRDIDLTVLEKVRKMTLMNLNRAVDDVKANHARRPPKADTASTALPRTKKIG